MLIKYIQGFKANLKAYSKRVAEHMDNMLQSDIVGVFASIAVVGLFSGVVLIVSIIAGVRGLWRK